MAGDKKITGFFYLFIILLFAQFAYGLVVRECYPGFMMPGFSRIDNNGKEYVTYDYILWYETKQAQPDTIIIPRPIRDAIYVFVANNRYKWFGKQDTCMIPTKELKDRFL